MRPSLIVLLSCSLLVDDPAAQQGQRLPSGREAGYVRQPDEDKIESFEAELAGYYKRRIHAKSLHLRMRARDRIASTQDPRALQLLIDGYTKPASGAKLALSPVGDASSRVAKPSRRLSWIA